jgi:YfiH family protein
MIKPIFQQKLKYGLLETYAKKPSIDFKKVHQVHGAKILDANNCNEHNEADGLYSLENNTRLCIITADCLPIIIEGSQGVCFLHAGWRGVQQKIYFNKEVINIKPQNIFIGPCISKDSFEVQQEFKKNFKNKYFSSIHQKLFFDLVGQVTSDLNEQFSDIEISSSSICTFKDLNFHSYRRNKTKERNWNIYTPYDL